MTEDQHIALVKAGDQFDIDLARAAAKAIRKVKMTSNEDDMRDAMFYLQDHTSLFSPRTYDLIKKELKWGMVP